MAYPGQVTDDPNRTANEKVENLGETLPTETAGPFARKTLNCGNTQQEVVTMDLDPERDYSVSDYPEATDEGARAANIAYNASRRAIDRGR